MVEATTETNFALQYLNFNYSQIVPIDVLGDFGVVVEADYDLSMGYKMPWYTEFENLIVRLKPYFKLGGIIHLGYYLYFVRIHMWNDIIGSELVVANFAALMDIMAYSHFCYEITAENENLRWVTHIQIDFNECMFGMFGVFLNDTLDCEWKKYWIEMPLFNQGLPYFDGEWIFVPMNCYVTDEQGIFANFN